MSRVGGDGRIRVMRIFSRLNVGGPSVHVILLTEKLDPAKYASTLVVGREGPDEGSFHHLARWKNVTPIVVPTLGRPIRALDDLRSFVALCRRMARERPHIVHTHTAKAGLLGRLAARVTGVPIVVHTFHGSVFSGYFGALGRSLYSVAERALACVTDSSIAVSPAVAAELEAHGVGPRNGIQIIPLGLELDRFSRSRPRGFLRARLGLHASVPLVGYVGRLVPIKDVGTLLSAIRSVEGAHLVLVGDGPERAKLSSLAETLGIGERVHFTGFLEELEPIYPDLDLAVNSSLNEGTPVALIEAMACGVPVVATAVGGSRDLLRGGELGTLVRAADPEALGKAILHELSHLEAARGRTERARKWVLERYRAARLVADIDQLYRALLHHKGLVGEPSGLSALQT